MAESYLFFSETFLCKSFQSTLLVLVEQLISCVMGKYLSKDAQSVTNPHTVFTLDRTGVFLYENLKEFLFLR